MVVTRLGVGTTVLTDILVLSGFVHRAWVTSNETKRDMDSEHWDI